MRKLSDQKKVYEQIWSQNANLLGSEIFEYDPVPIYTVGTHLPEDFFGEISKVVETLRRFQPDASHQWLRPDQMHITLDLPGRPGEHFQEEDIPRMTEWLQDICRSIQSFEVELGNLNCFPVALFREIYDHNGSLYALHDAIADTIPWSQHPEYRHENYTPHMSVCYIKEDAQAIVQHPEFDRVLEPSAMHVRSIYFSKWFDRGTELVEEPIATIELGTGNVF